MSSKQKSITVLTQDYRLRAEARRRALKILFIISMDNGVQMDNAVLHAVQDAIESLICPIPSTGEIASIVSLRLFCTYPRSNGFVA